MGQAIDGEAVRLIWIWNLTLFPAIFLSLSKFQKLFPYLKKMEIIIVPTSEADWKIRINETLLRYWMIQVLCILYSNYPANPTYLDR